ncbi:hypothetical protein BURK_004647 [Burkholderia sp. SJ98]|nr:hypothetical protein BURK_004647 [Burkholderia sp. SJ98]
MDTCDADLLGAFELRTIDADISHIRLAITAVMREPNSALPLLYWRRRLERLLSSGHLLHHQFCAVTALITRVAEVETLKKY